VNRALIRHILAAVRNPVAAARAIKTLRHGKPANRAIRDGKKMDRHLRWQENGNG
jgi:hypothetical protein